MVNKVLLVLSLFCFALNVHAQEWQTDFDGAKEIATTANKNILLVFQGSDWCAPCIKMEREIWNTTEFKNHAAENLVLLKADFPKRKQNKLEPEQQEKNNQLAERFNKNGFFPFVLLIDSNAHVLGSTGYNNLNPKQFIQLLNSFKSEE